MTLIPVILSGGIGSRLWPMSRALRPKHTLSFLGAEESLFQQTLLRLSTLSESSGFSIASPIVVCHEEHRFLMAQQLQMLAKEHAYLLKTKLILEPEGKNTAPAIALAAMEVLRELSLSRDFVSNKTSSNVDSECLLLVLPSDHLMTNMSCFAQSLVKGVALAQAGGITAFGVTPTCPETGFGYLQMGKDHQVTRFVEKPDVETAQSFLDSGAYFWNAGIYLMSPDVYLDALKTHRPVMYQHIEQAFSGRQADHDFIRIDANAFHQCNAESIDHAVMEQTALAKVVPYKGNWHDLGSWDAVSGLSNKDAQGNTLLGDVITLETKDCYVQGEHRLITTLGVQDLMIIDTADALLVMHKDSAQSVKTLVQQLQTENRPEVRLHQQVHRPWGSYQWMAQGRGYQVKRLIVAPYAKLSLQRHQHRAEHWVVVRGTAQVTLGDAQFTLTKDQSTFIPIGKIHALENHHEEPLEVIEVQSGDYLGEEDIERFEDRYGRVGGNL